MPSESLVHHGEVCIDSITIVAILVKIVYNRVNGVLPKLATARNHAKVGCSRCMDENADALDAVRTAVAAYDTALRADDLDAVGVWFDAAPTTSRFGERGAVRGASEIDAMRRRQAPGMARGRVDGRADVWLLAPGAVVATLEFTRPDGSQGLRTQVWRLTADGWRISHAHLSVIA